MQPLPPIALKASAMSSLPDSWTKSGPQPSRWADTRAIAPLASFTATNTLGKAVTMRAIVAGWMSVTVRPGTL